MITTLDWDADRLDHAELSFVDNIRRHGWLRTAALAEPEKPGFSYTTGFAVNTGQPELMIFSTADAVAHEMFWVLFRRAKAGQPLPLGRRTDAFFSNLPAYAFPVAPRHYADYLGWSRWFYRGDSFGCLQIVWPDRAGIFPWEAGFDQHFAADQVDLTERGWTAEIRD
ncbi:DUF4262 domain-containing protein [Sphingomonas sp. IC-56]|uniref:DUF4262 domain-containing protein n=1 Tax=Sphingomonas sp. IC-56 TaxID=2898529 RepID=UPI001E3F3CEF|nr:DUF4262 domain-containing protein [Sphingomonas sp. IC-56]